MQEFLELWTRYNVFIINWLLVTIFVLVGFVIYFAGFRTQAHPEGGGQISPDLENTLKKLLDQQALGKTAAPTSAGEGATAEGATPDAETAAPSPAVAELQAQIVEKEKVIQELQTKAAAGGVAGDEGQLQERIKELEARLSEYEIIAEDIADLSFYKEENQKLQKEVDEMKKGSFVAAAPTAAPAPETAPQPVAEAAPTPTPAPVVDPAPVSPVQATSAPAAEPDDGSELVGAPIDDDLMKEFAAAVESQKSTTQEASTAAPAPEQAATPPTENANPAPPTDENAQLLNQFEDFVKKS